MNEDKKLEELAAEFKKIKRTETARLSSWAIIYSRRKKRKIHILPTIVTVALSVVTVFLLIFIINNPSQTYQNATQVIPFVEVSDSKFTINYSSENMDRGQYEYMTVGTENKIVIDPLVKNFKRGDVVYYKTPEYISGLQGLQKKQLSLKENLGLNVKEHQLSRVVGLPGEKVEIRKGQIFINDKKLDTFYSFPTVRGMDKNEYFKTKDASSSGLTKEDFEEDMEPIYIPNNSFFVMGDQWSRSIDSRLFGPLSFSSIEGKAVGYEKSK